MSWQPRHRRGVRPVSQRASRALWWLTALLLAINAAVIAYYGDPRTLLGRRAAALAGARPDAPTRPKSRVAPRPASTPAGHVPPAELTGVRASVRIFSALSHLLVRPAHAGAPAAPAAAAVAEAEAEGRPAAVGHSPANPAASAAKPTPPTFVGPPQPLDPLAELRTPGLVQRIERVRLGEGRSPTHALQAVGVASHDIRGIVHALMPVTHLHRMRASDTFTIRFDGGGRLVNIELARGPLEQVVVRRQGSSFVAERQRIAVDTVVQEVTGNIGTSLWDALVQSGEDPRLAQQLVDIFAYEVDFYSEVRTGDSFRLLVEKRYAHGQFLGYGDMLAAELVVGGEPHRAFLSRQEGVAEYFDQAGDAMRKQLLRMPLQYGAVTSRFGRRRHPILGYTRAHNGVDYGVPIGTPCWSVGDGKVLRAGWHGGYGRLVEVAHANGWVSQYAHLSHINVRVGQKIRQKQVVGLVGMTGLATGPHLHYGLKHHGHYVNSLAQRFERAHGLSGAALTAFQAEVARYLGELDKLQVAQDPRSSGAGNG